MSTIYLNRLHNKLDTTSVELIVQMTLLEPIRKSSEDLVLHARSLAWPLSASSRWNSNGEDHIEGGTHRIRNAWK